MTAAEARGNSDISVVLFVLKMLLMHLDEVAENIKVAKKNFLTAGVASTSPGSLTSPRFLPALCFGLKP